MKCATHFTLGSGKSAIQAFSLYSVKIFLEEENAHVKILGS